MTVEQKSTLQRTETGNGSLGRYTEFLETSMHTSGFASKGQRTRFRLKLATARVLETNSFPGLRVSDICVNAGVALGTFYVYFDDKAEVAAEVLLDFGDALYAEARRAARGRANFDAILATNRFFVVAYQNNAGLLRSLVQLEEQDSDFRSSWRHRRLEWLESIASSIGRRTDSEDAPPDLLTQIAFAMEGMVFQYLYDMFVREEPILSPSTGDSDSVAELLSTLWYRAIFREDPPEEMLTSGDALQSLHRK